MGNLARNWIRSAAPFQAPPGSASGAELPEIFWGRADSAAWHTTAAFMPAGGLRKAPVTRP